jgi:RNA polymerase sigma-70 factor (ECF subfamily)
MAGDDAAFSEVVRRRQSAIRNLMRRLCRDPALADDLAQQTFLQAWRTLRGLKSVNAFGAWLRKVAVNVWLQHVRTGRAQWVSVEDLPEIESPAPAPVLNEQIDLDSALATLPPDMRLCIVLTYSEGMSHGEISAMTTFPLGTVKSHVTRGAARLRKFLHSYQHDIGAVHGG